jgi:hypothetical protein
VCFGKTNVIEAIQSLYDDGYAGTVGMVDADFDRVDGVAISHEGLVVSAFHDFDLEMAFTDSLRRYLKETAHADKLEFSGGLAGVRTALMQGVRPLSVLRYANQKLSLRYRLDRVSLEQFFNDLKADVPGMIDEVSQGRFATGLMKKQLEEHINRFLGLHLDLHQITSGHDFCAALGLALRDKLGGRKPQQTYRSEIELHLRLTFTLDDLASTTTYASLRAWEDENPGYKILKKH